MAAQPPQQGPPERSPFSTPFDTAQAQPSSPPAAYPYDQQTAASSAATHNQAAAVYHPPSQGQAQPAPGGGPNAAGIPPAAAPLPAAPQQLLQRPAQPSQVPAAAIPTTSVDALVRQSAAGTPPDRPQKGGRRRRRDRDDDLTPEQMQDKVIRLSFIVVFVIVIVAYVSGIVRKSAGGTEGLFNNGVVDIVGLFGMGAALFLLVRAARVSGRMRGRPSPTESSRLSYINMGGIALWLVPIIGSFGYRVGLVFQSSAMHPIYYGLGAVGVLMIMYGLAGSKERTSFFKLFMFAVYGILVATIPMGFPVIGDLFASDFWWSSTFIMISMGFIFMSMTLRQMRQGQYSQLSEVLERADRSFSGRRWDEASKAYAEAITLAHTLYSDVVFSSRNPRDRSGPSVPDEYFRPWIGKAKCLALSGKLRKALAIYELMLEVDPDNSKVWFDRGRILVAEKRFAEAYISFDRAVKLDPTLEEAKQSRAEVLDEIRKLT